MERGPRDRPAESSEESDSDRNYLLPRHPSEVSRLDLQHYALRETLRANYLAPIDEPARILDVGTGTGRWVFDLCHAFPRALGVGLDLVAIGSASGPSNYRFVRGDVTAGLPFDDATFDFVHQRLLRLGIPTAAWDGVIAELVRVTAPGGWVELAEVGVGIESIGPATEALFDSAAELGVGFCLGFAELTPDGHHYN
ncbi:MAG: methyltransferase domain-containing protein, partial [Candidatus Dormiibacterota bacterium]